MSNGLLSLIKMLIFKMPNIKSIYQKYPRENFKKFD